MDNITLLYFLIGGTCAAACSCAFFLNRIYKILRHASGGDPTIQDSLDDSFRNVRMKK